MSEMGSEDRAKSLGQGLVKDGILEGPAEMMKEAGGPMLKAAKPGARFVLKRIPGAPAMVYDLAEFATSPNKTRAGFALAGGVLGSMAGGGLGTLAGGVNAPIGAVVGSAMGEHVGEQIYDENRQAIDGFVDPKVAATKHAIDAATHSLQGGWRQLFGAPN